MPVIIQPLTPAQLAPALRRHMWRRHEEVAIVARRIAKFMALDGEKRARAEEIEATGTYADGFKARNVPGGALVINDAPYASVIEFGRRPGASGPPWRAILQWLMMKEFQGTLRMPFSTRMTRAEKESIARVTAGRIHNRGIRPKRFMERLFRKWVKTFRREVNNNLRTKPVSGVR